MNQFERYLRTNARRKKKFWTKYKLNPETGCWEWQLYKDKDGYGTQNVSHATYRAHHLAYEYSKGRIPSHLLVLHTCDNPSCINPDHLYLGTNADNHHDRAMKGRGHRPYKFGEQAPMSNLKEQNIKAIRSLYPYITVINLAKLFNTTTQNIYDVLNRKTWCCVPILTEQEVLEIRNRYASQYT